MYFCKIWVRESAWQKRACDKNLSPTIWKFIMYCHVIHAIIFHKPCGQAFSIGQYLNPLRAKFFKGNINIYLHFVSFLHIDTTQVVEILPQKRQEPSYSTQSISWLLMSWRRKEVLVQQSTSLIPFILMLWMLVTDTPFSMKRAMLLITCRKCGCHGTAKNDHYMCQNIHLWFNTLIDYLRRHGLRQWR